MRAHRHVPRPGPWESEFGFGPAVISHPNPGQSGYIPLHAAHRKFSTSSEGVRPVIIMMPEHRVKRTAKRLQKVLDSLEIDFRYTACIDLAARLHGFENWYPSLSET